MQMSSPVKKRLPKYNTQAHVHLLNSPDSVKILYHNLGQHVKLKVGIVQLWVEKSVRSSCDGQWDTPASQIIWLLEEAW